MLAMKNARCSGRSSCWNRTLAFGDAAP